MPTGTYLSFLVSNPASKDNFARYRRDTIAYNCNLLYSKDFYTARNFLNKNFQVLSIRGAVSAGNIAMGEKTTARQLFLFLRQNDFYK